MQNHGFLSDEVLAQKEVPPQSITTGAINGAGVDMQGWEGVAFLTNIGAITGVGTLDARAEQADDSGFTTNKVNVTNAALAQVSVANALHILEVYRPTQRFVRAVVTQAVNTVVAEVTSIRYRRTGTLPPTQSATQTVKVAAN